MPSPGHASDHMQDEQTAKSASIDGSIEQNNHLDGGTALGSSQTSSRPRHRKHRNQASSSFRLQSPITSVTRRADAGSITPQSARRGETYRSRRSATKHQPDDAELVVAKRESHRKRHPHRPSARNSALDHVVFNNSPEGEAPSHNTAVGSNPESVPNLTTSTEPASSSPHNQPSVGLDTDPAQIVNLALVLSESRKQGSLGRTASTGVQRNRRSTSAALPTPKLRDSLNPPKNEGNETQDTSTPPPSEGGTGNPQQEPRTSTQSSLPNTAIALRFGDNNYGPIDFSNATLGRAKRARDHFDLFSEYLRLLPHLPPLRPPKENHSTGDRDASTQGREYNPLQYIRNRKIRFRERCPIDSDAKGWGDVERVREWVDEVITTHNSNTHQPNECLQLPSMETSQEAADPGDQEQPGPLQQSKSNVSDTGRPRRPRKDWLVSPLDLLADAAWLETGSNKSKIEDCEGNKVFPAGTRFKTVPIPETSPSFEDSQSHDQVEQGNDTIEAAEGPSTSSQIEDRGRRKHRFRNSTYLTPTHSHSRTTATPGHRKRSRSSSSSSTSSKRGNGRWSKRFSRLRKKQFDQPGEANFEHNKAELQRFNGANIGDNPKIPGTAHHTSLPPLDTMTDEAILPSPRQGYTTPSHAPSQTIKEGTPRVSVDEIYTTQSSPVYDNSLPRMTINLSPLRGRSPSPSGKLPPTTNHSRKWSKKMQANGWSGRWFASEDPASNHENPFSPIGRPKIQELHRAESSPTKSPRTVNQPESKVRGIFKGGRIAEIMGNEVSKVGDFIRKKDSPSHSRQVSSASSITSEFNDAADDPYERKKSKTKSQPGHSSITQDTGLQPIKISKDDTPRYHPPGLPVFTSTLKGRQNQDPVRLKRPTSADSTDSHRTLPISFSKEDNNRFRQLNPLEAGDTSEVPSKPPKNRKSFNQGFAADSDSLAQARLSAATRNWSISSQGNNSRPGFERIDRREITRVRAHLLSSGIKALELCRHATKSPHFCVESWLKSRTNCDAIAPYIASSEDTMLKARDFVSSFDHKSADFQNSLMEFSNSKVPALRSDLERIEYFVASSITPRVRKATTEAENMTSELATTNTLAIKELHDALDKGIRKRNRRLRWISRFGYVLLEWVLVGVMWWAWTIVMMWKIIRGVWRGTVSGVRWVFWL